MKLLTLLLVILSSQIVNSAPILVTENKVSLQEYKEACQSKNYSCFPASYFEITDFQNTDVNQLLNTFDLDSQEYVNKFYSQVPLILKTQALSQNQFEQLLLSSEKLISEKKLSNKMLSFHEKLKQLYSLLDELQKVDSLIQEDSFIIIFDKAFKNTQFNLDKIKSISDLVMIKIVKYNSIQKINDVPEYFLEGNCQNPQFQTELSNSQKRNQILVPLFDSKCSFSESFGSTQNKITQHFKENKNIYLTVAAVLLTAYLMKNYEITYEK